MRLFFREHRLLLLMQGVVLFGALGIYWLDGYHHVLPALYSVFLGLFLTALYLAYQYVSRRQYYRVLSQPLSSPEDILQRTDQTPIGEALQTLLRHQYRYYHEQLDSNRREQQEHLTFMDQWVHQMKTPLAVIELTVQQVDEPEFASIREELEQMRANLNMVLYMARLRNFQQDFHIKTLSLSRLISEVVHDHKRSFIRNGVYPEVKEPDGELVVESDEKWLFFMLSQIVLNAVKYSSGSGQKVHITSFVRAGHAVVQIRDHGVGIPLADRTRVFDAFFTGENGRHFRESTGMGLYLTQEAAKRLDHQLELESTPGEGTTLRIVFPSYQRRAATNLQEPDNLTTV
ncbi:sensor histidine kinase [Paenibacillus sp. WLX2291]|uniref:sensor histidine kinase n=1 Tax=Paenibacillus sp. WLX2291 TaxID=3296934 RepID=UPI0039845D0F